jgi:hypothetical protein
MIKSEIQIQIQIKEHTRINEGSKQNSPAGFIELKVYHIISESKQITEDTDKLHGRMFHHVNAPYFIYHSISAYKKENQSVNYQWQQYSYGDTQCPVVFFKH